MVKCFYKELGERGRRKRVARDLPIIFILSVDTVGDLIILPISSVIILQV